MCLVTLLYLSVSVFGFVLHGCDLGCLSFWVLNRVLLVSRYLTRVVTQMAFFLVQPPSEPIFFIGIHR